MRLCFELPDAAFPIKLEQHETARGLFRVTYGKQVRDGLNYVDAAHELGECILHALACDSKLVDSED